MAAPRHTLLKLAPQLEMVIDLPVEDDQKAPTGGSHRLIAGSGQFEDRQAAVGECDADSLIGPNPRCVRAAVRERGSHYGSRLAQGSSLPGGIDETRYSAHCS